MIEIDKILEKCGDFHRYQIMLLSLFCIINLLSSIHYYSQTIISFVPKHWCYAEVNSTLGGHSGASSCYLDHDGNRTECGRYVFDLDYGYESMTSELNWVCGSAWKSTLGQSVFFIGSCIGSMALGIAADNYGRLPVLIIANMIAVLGNFATIFASSVEVFAMCRFVAGLATDSNFLMMYILVMEYIRPSMRTAGLSICIGVFYCLGSVVTPWIAVALGNWKDFLLYTSIPFVVVPFFGLVVPESAQWLVTKRRYDEAVECFRRIARFNKRQLDDDVYIKFKEGCKQTMNETEGTASLLGLMKTPRLRKHTLILFFKSMVITLCYDAISRNVEGLGLSPFIMFSLSATAIFPACLVLILLQDRIGRKAMASSSLLISGIFTAATGIIIAYEKAQNTSPVLLASLSIIGRFGVTVAYNSGAQYATELIPTCVRGQGVAAVHVAGYAFTFFSSYILLSQTIFAALPSLLLGVLSFIGAGLCLLLPETLNRTLPCTLEAAEEFGRGERLFDFACFRKRTDQHSQSTDRLDLDEGSQYF